MSTVYLSLLQEEELKHRGREKYGDVPLQMVYIYRCKPTLGVAIEGGANTRQPLPRVISVQVRADNKELVTGIYLPQTFVLRSLSLTPIPRSLCSFSLALSVCSSLSFTLLV